MPGEENDTGRQDRPLFSVLTATYQGAETLPNVYRALCEQTCRDFEWIVVDDGSTDATADLVAGWHGEGRMPIRLLRQPNGGKFRAVEAGVDAASGELLVMLDDDDRCVPEALARFRDLWRGLPADERARCAGLLALCRSPQGDIVGRPFPPGAKRATMQELVYRHRNAGERWAAVRADLHRRFRFPDVPQEIRFLPEGLVWHRLAREHPFACVNEPLRIFEIHAGGLSDRVRRGDPAMMPGLILYHRMILDEEIGWFRQAPDILLRSAANLTRYRLQAGGKVPVPGPGLRNPWAKLLVAVMAPAGMLLFLIGRLAAR